MSKIGGVDCLRLENVVMSKCVGGSTIGGVDHLRLENAGIQAKPKPRCCVGTSKIGEVDHLRLENAGTQGGATRLVHNRDIHK